MAGFWVYRAKPGWHVFPGSDEYERFVPTVFYFDDHFNRGPAWWEDGWSRYHDRKRVPTEPTGEPTGLCFVFQLPQASLTRPVYY